MPQGHDARRVISCCFASVMGGLAKVLSEEVAAGQGSLLMFLDGYLQRKETLPGCKLQSSCAQRHFLQFYEFDSNSRLT